MELTNLPLIAGAGPVGLAAALFLARQGVRVRLIDRRATPSDWSRALAVNPRTLDLLEPTGLTATMLSMGLPIHGATFYRDRREIASVSFDKLPHRYPYMLALSQSTTERLLADALAKLGGSVERGVELTNLCHDGNGVKAELKHAANPETPEHMKCPWLLAADGARSVVRSTLGLSFEGSTFARDWHLADAPLDTRLVDDRAHIFFLPGGRFVFCIRVVHDRAAPVPPLWRIMGNLPDPVAHLPMATAAGPAVWASRFTIAHRLAERLSAGRIFLAGDAAHVHSPVGARGMNLGIEDAWSFAQAIRTNRLDAYGPARHRVDRGVVRRVELVTRMARGESMAARFARRFLLPRVVSVPAARRRMLATLSGLDHPLPAP